MKQERGNSELVGKRRERILYKIYYSAAGKTFSFLDRITPVGFGVIAFMFLGGILSATGSNKGRGALFQVVSLTISILVMSFVLSIFRKIAINAKRELPRFGTVDEELSYSVEVQNLGKQSIKDAWLLDMEPDKRPPEERFVLTKEPGEEERNIFDRTFIFYRWKWLVSSLVLFEAKSARKSIELKKYGKQRVSMSFVPLRRGLIELKNLRVLLPDPLGLFQRCQEIECPAESVLVLPKRYKLGEFRMPGAVTFNLGGEMGASRLGDSGDFVSIRDYRPGDALKNIHWKSWARIGKPAVKEYEDTYYPRYGLILDTAEHGALPQVFEEAVSIAASFASTLNTEECLLDLMFFKGEALRVTAGRGVARPERLLEILAGIEPDAEHNLSELERLIIQHREDLTGCVLILCFWSERRVEFIRKIVAQGIALRVLLVANDNNETKELLVNYPCPAPVHVLDCANIQESLLNC